MSCLAAQSKLSVCKSQKLLTQLWLLRGYPILGCTLPRLTQTREGFLLKFATSGRWKACVWKATERCSPLLNKCLHNRVGVRLIRVAITELITRKCHDLEALCIVLLMELYHPFITRLDIGQSSIGGHINNKADCSLKFGKVYCIS